MRVVSLNRLPGCGGWLAETDRDYWLGVLSRAAWRHLDTLPDCEGCGVCERCVLGETLAYTAKAGAA